MTHDSGVSACNRPHKILVAIDSSPASTRALEYARHLVPAAAEVTVISVAENPRTLVATPSLVAAELKAARDELLKDAEQSVLQAGDVFADTDVALRTEVIDLAKHRTDIAHALAESAQRVGAELIVVGARQHHGLLRWVEGTVSEPLAKLSRCPLLIVPIAYDGAIAGAPRRILFAVDGSATAARAVRCGAQFATAGAHLRAIYVIDRAVRLSDFVPIHLLADAFLEEGKSALTATREMLAGVSAETSTALVDTERTNDDVAHAIMRDAQKWQAELIVIGTHGRRGIAHWFVGSVAGRLARITHTPLLLVPSPRS